MAGRLKQPDCNGRDCTDGCDGPTIGTITCVSRQGNGTLCGWSKFQNQNSGDLNGRKMRCRSLIGNSIIHKHDSPADRFGCSFDRYCGTEWAIDKCFTGCTRPSATSSVTELCNGASEMCSSGSDFFAGCDVCSGSCSGSWDPADSVADYSAGIQLTQTDYSRIYAGDDQCHSFVYEGDSLTYKASGSAEIKLRTPDTVSAALIRGGIFSEGTACRTGIASVGTATASANVWATGSGSLSLTGASAVTATIPITGLTNGTAYTVTVKINRYTAGGGSYVDFVYDTIEFTAGASTEDIEYDLPVNTDYDYEIDTSYKDIAAA
jgi:hypothetical protein